MITSEVENTSVVRNWIFKGFYNLISSVADPGPDPVFLPGFGSGSGFQIFLEPNRFQPRFWNKKKECRNVSKSDLSEEN